MSTVYSSFTYERAAEFFDRSPTGQYDEEAAHALRCHHDLLEALEDIAKSEAADYMRGVALDAIAKAKGR